MIQRSKLGLKFFSPAFSTPCLSSGPVNRSDAWHITVALPAQKGCAQTISANVLNTFYHWFCAQVIAITNKLNVSGSLRVFYRWIRHKWVREQKYYVLLLYGPVSQGLGTTKFTNLIGWNRYWPRSRFSHLDRQCFEVKKSQTKMQNHWLFSSNNMYFCKCQKADEKKKIKRTSKLWKN